MVLYYDLLELYILQKYMKLFVVMLSAANDKRLRRDIRIFLGMELVTSTSVHKIFYISLRSVELLFVVPIIFVKKLRSRHEEVLYLVCLSKLYILLQVK